MILFLTSSPCDNNVPEGVDLPCIFNEVNGFVDRLRDALPYDGQPVNFLIIAANPDDAEGNDEMLDTFVGALEYHGIEVADAAVIDHRNAQDVAGLLYESDIVLLSGGHVPTEAEFFEEIGLDMLMPEYEGIVIGVSAGSMNCAETVYCQPEEEGESLDPDFERFIPGLGLTGLNILPHYQQVKDNILDGQRLFEDITYPDSYIHPLLALVDGSYVVSYDGKETVCGEAYLLWDGHLTPICREGETLDL